MSRPVGVSWPYSALQGVLLTHRIEMRLMMEQLEVQGFEEVYHAFVIERTGNTGFWLGECYSGCPPSCPFCKQNPEDDRINFLEAENALLRRELQDRRDFIIAVKSCAKPQSLVPPDINKHALKEVG